MSIEIEESELRKNPNLKLPHLKYLLTLPLYQNDRKVISEIMDSIKNDDMAPWYTIVCEELNWKFDEDLLTLMKSRNDAIIQGMDATIQDAEENLGELEVRDAYLKKAEYYSLIGDQENALTIFRKTYEKTVSFGHRLDIIFHIIRIGFFFMDHELLKRNLAKAESLMEEGGDWDRRNRLKVYQGVYSVATRDFKTASNLFLDSVSTFSSYEIMDYDTFIKYTVYLSLISLPRNQLKNKIINGSEIMQALHSNPDVKNFVFSLYNCHYSAFFTCLAKVEVEMKEDYLFHLHYRHYVWEMKILAYKQILDSYRSLTLTYMSEQFGVSVEYIDEELSRFIACGRLHCQIDRVGGIVETNHPDQKTAQYQAILKQGDHLLTRVQKLSRVVDI